MKRCFVYFALILYAVMTCESGVCAGVLARGDGFEVDSSDVDAQMEYFREKGFESSNEGHLNSVLKLRLFALEAKEKGIISELPNTDAPYSKKKEVGAYLGAYKSYLAFLLETYPVSEDAIVSYYYSYPERFSVENNDDKANSNQGLMPLDSNIKNWIRFQILESKKPAIIEGEFVRLKAKYHVIME